MKSFIHILLILLRIALGIFFILSGYLKLFPIEMLELSIVETGIFNWAQSMFLARLLIGFEIMLGIMLIFRAYRKLTWILTISTLVVFTIYLAYLMVYMPGISDCGCMGFAVHMSPLTSIYKNIILLTISISIWLLEKRFYGKWIENYLNSKWLGIASIVIAFTIPFVINPLSLERADKLSSDELLTTTLNLEDEAFLTWQSNDTTKIADGKKLVCYFSPYCKFCQMTARKIRMMLLNSDEPFLVYFIFAGNPEAREKLLPFYTETMTENIPTAIIDEDKFFSVSGPLLPVVFYVDGNTIVGKDNFMTLTDNKVANFFQN